MRSLKRTSNSKKNRLPLNFKQLSDAEEIILSGLLGKPREFLIAHAGELHLKDSQLRTFEFLRRKLTAGWPLAYLVGYRWFYNRKFFVSPAVLVPRPETELLVEKTLLAARSLRPKFIVDVGTGSGAIIVSLRKELSASAKFFAVDISAAALKMAKQNARQLRSAKIKFIKGSLLTPLFKTLRGQQRVIICANLPYVSKKELAEPSIKHEPRLALYGGKNPTEKIARLLQQISMLKLIKSEVFLEFNWGQSREIKNLAKKYLPDSKIEIHKDLSGHDRATKISLK